MSRNSPVPQHLVEEVYRLAATLWEANPDQQQLDALERLLEAEPEARRIYVQFIQESAGLHVWAAGDSVNDLGLSHSPALSAENNHATDHAIQPTGTVRRAWDRAADKVERHMSLRMIVTLVLTTVGLGLLIAWIAPRSLEDQIASPSPAPAADSQFVAKLTRGVRMKWSDASDISVIGSSIRAGEKIDLAEGLAEIRFSSGATVILEGPAIFVVSESSDARGPGEGWLEAGKLTARVPKQAGGFAIDTEFARVVDLGTEFGLDVNPASGVVAQTFLGVIEVSWDRPADGGAPRQTQRIAAGHAWQVSSDGAAGPPEHRPIEFVRDLPSRISPEQFTLELGPVAYFRMEPTGDASRLVDSAHGLLASLVAGELEPRIVPGRIGTSLSLRGGAYADAGDVAAFGRSDAFSYGAWVRPVLGGKMAILSRMQPNQSYRGYDLFIDSDGRVMFHLIDGFPASLLRVDATEPLVAEAWQHVLATYDGSGRAAGVTLYVDGSPVVATAGADALAGDFKMDTHFRIGRRGGDDAGDIAVPYQGDIDELAIFDRELTSSEVEGIVRGAYRAAVNKP